MAWRHIGHTSEVGRLRALSRPLCGYALRPHLEGALAALYWIRLARDSVGSGSACCALLEWGFFPHSLELQHQRGWLRTKFRVKAFLQIEWHAIASQRRVFPDDQTPRPPSGGPRAPRRHAFPAIAMSRGIRLVSSALARNECMPPSPLGASRIREGASSKVIGVIRQPHAPTSASRARKMGFPCCGSAAATASTVGWGMWQGPTTATRPPTSMDGHRPCVGVRAASHG